jgi:hypothetical protein
MSPTLALRLCAYPGCSASVPRGYCAQHTPDVSVRKHAYDARRGTAHSRGYTQRWTDFRPWFLQALIHAEILPVCGAALPDGPKTHDSYCVRAGLFTVCSADGSSLHFDHDPPLTDAERTNELTVCDPRRIQLLCAECHAVRSARQGSALTASPTSHASTT